MNDVFLYNHGGSRNHGCEALARSVCKLIKPSPILISDNIEEDYSYGVNTIMEVQPSMNPYKKLSYDFLKAYYHLKVEGNYTEMDILPYRKRIVQLDKTDCVISIGGDVYCYEDYKKYIRLHELITQRGCKTILFGCSLEESLFQDAEFVSDIKQYDAIIARESLTLNYLKNNGVTNVFCYPDPAFGLPAVETDLPETFLENKTIGLNISPLVLNKEKTHGILMSNYRNLIDYIINETSYNVALIPHVVWDSNDDRVPLRQLYSEFAHTNRISLIDDQRAECIKWIISKCYAFIGARTHSTIAAYSSCIPTLVLGYSIKSKGIAKDLFGSYEDYVIAYDEITSEMDLLSRFKRLLEDAAEIRVGLQNKMSEYNVKLKECGDKLQQLIAE